MTIEESDSITVNEKELLINLNNVIEDVSTSSIPEKDNSNPESKLLFSLSDSSRDAPPSPCCSDPIILTCHFAQVSVQIFTSETPIMFPGSKHAFTFSNVIPPNGKYYTTVQGDEATITMNPATTHVFGGVKISDRSFSLEHCDTHQVWIEYNVDSFKEDLEETFEKIGVNPPAALDNSTMAEFSVMIYYTPQFAAITPDIPGFVDQVLAETNQGYTNSRVPMTIKLHCIEEATFSDTSSTTEALTKFVAMKKTTESLLNSADTTVLLMASSGSVACGQVYKLNAITTGDMISVCTKSCALGYYSFGHELAHTFGAYHNLETGHLNPYYWFGQGHLVARGEASTGVRTVLAYKADGHTKRVNFYSNPEVIYPGTGTHTGTEMANNAYVLTRNRMAIGSVGDESASCS